MKEITRIAGAVLVYTSICTAQNPVTPLKFEAASIKPADPHSSDVSAQRAAGEGLELRNISVRNLITLAYGLRDFQLIGGPGWIDSESYDVIAKSPVGEAATTAGRGGKPESEDQRKARFARLGERLRSLLADRFGLVVHHEARSQSVYLLNVAPKGSKLIEVDAPDRPPHKQEGRGHSQGFAVPMDMLVATLSDATHLMVVDHTGLTGRYNYTLNWDPRSTSANADPEKGPLDSTGPTIFTALVEQLGLVLKSGKAPVDVVVVDQVERPSPN